jgi:hypothetical protein
MLCYKCKKELSSSFAFSCVCEHCFTYQHSCLNCQHYSQGKHNDCKIPEADLISDKEKGNRCEYMQARILEQSSSIEKDKKQAENDFHALFGEDPPEKNEKTAKEKFDDLFK